MKGVVVKKNADLFDVRFGQMCFSCTARGGLKKEGIFVGDKVEFDKQKSIIECVLTRKNLLIRPPIANLDQMIIVVAKKPAVDLYLVDKLILFCFVYGIKPILCVNKIDDETTFYEDMQKIYGGIVKVIKTSALKGDVSSLEASIVGVCAFAGQSAVGKSSLINAIFKEERERVGDFAKKIERGKQTTRTVTLYKTQKGYIADTAGFSKLDETLIDLKPNEISRYYPDFLPYLEKCKFRSCLHKNSNDCEIIKRVKSGEIAKSRYDNYLKFLDFKQKQKTWGEKWKKTCILRFLPIQ